MVKLYTVQYGKYVKYCSQFTRQFTFFFGILNTRDGSLNHLKLW